MANKNNPNEPPEFIDGAKVLKWAWAGNVPFGFVGDELGNNKIEIFGLAICSYGNQHEVYRFSCNQKWETIQDGLYDTIEDAISELPEQYKLIQPIWNTR